MRYCWNYVVLISTAVNFDELLKERQKIIGVVFKLKSKELEGHDLIN